MRHGTKMRYTDYYNRFKHLIEREKHPNDVIGDIAIVRYLAEEHNIQTSTIVILAVREMFGIPNCTARIEALEKSTGQYYTPRKSGLRRKMERNREAPFFQCEHAKVDPDATWCTFTDKRFDREEYKTEVQRKEKKNAKTKKSK